MGECVGETAGECAKCVHVSVECVVSVRVPSRCPLPFMAPAPLPLHSKHLVSGTLREHTHTHTHTNAGMHTEKQGKSPQLVYI